MFGLQDNESCDATSLARALPRSYITCLKLTEVTFRISPITTNTLVTAGQQPNLC
jgi:hypothetical protein